MGERVLRPGLCSVTYRRLPAAEVAGLAADAGLAAVEWGGDVHAPPGAADDLATVRATTAARGLAVAAYGSYFRAGPHGPAEFGPVLDAALAIGAPRIRIWAGTLGSAESDRSTVDAVVASTRAAARQAAAHDVLLGFEFHRNTLTDTVESTLRLLDAVNEPNVATYWQPPVGLPADAAVAGLERVLDQVCALHVFSWWPDTHRLPLTERADLWRAVFAVAARAGRPLDALLEFVPGDDPDVLAAEAAALRAATA